MSRPTLDGAAAEARSTLPEPQAAAFDRLAGAVLASPAAPLGALLRAQLPGTAGVRWLRQEQLPPTTRPSALTAAHWLSLYECWSSVHRAPGPRGRRPRPGPGPLGGPPGPAGQEGRR